MLLNYFMSNCNAFQLIADNFKFVKPFVEMFFISQFVSFLIWLKDKGHGNLW